MSIRDHFKKRVQICFLAALLSWILMAVVVAIGIDGSSFYAVAGLSIIGLAGLLGSIIYLAIFIRCPKCKLALGQTAAALELNPWSKHRLHYCPSCGQDFSEEK